MRIACDPFLGTVAQPLEHSSIVKEALKLKKTLKRALAGGCCWRDRAMVPSSPWMSWNLPPPLVS